MFLLKSKKTFQESCHLNTATSSTTSSVSLTEILTHVLCRLHFYIILSKAFLSQSMILHISVMFSIHEIILEDDTTFWNHGYIGNEIFLSETADISGAGTRSI